MYLDQTSKTINLVPILLIMVTQDPFYRWNNYGTSLRAKLKSMPDREAFNSQLWAPLTTTYLQIHTWQTWKLVFKSVIHSSFSAGKILRKNGYRSKSTQKDTQIVFFLWAIFTHVRVDEYSYIPLQSKFQLKANWRDKLKNGFSRMTSPNIIV